MSPELSTRLKILRSAPLDRWIALSEDESRIVAVGQNYMEAARKSDEAGEANPLILKTPAVWAPASF